MPKTLFVVAALSLAGCGAAATAPKPLGNIILACKPGTGRAIILIDPRTQIVRDSVIPCVPN